MDDYPVHSIPSHHYPKIDVLPKSFLQIIIAAEWLVRHSSSSPIHTTFAFSFVFIQFFYGIQVHLQVWGVSARLTSQADASILFTRLLIFACLFILKGVRPKNFGPLIFVWNLSQLAPDTQTNCLMCAFC